MWLKELTHGDYIVVSTVFAGICGSVSYLLKIEEGKKFKWMEFFIHVTASMIFGLLAFEFFSYEGVPDEFCGAIAGSSGWLGTRVARIVEILVCRKFNISKDDLS